MEDSATVLPAEVCELGQMYLAQMEDLKARVAELDRKSRRAAKQANLTRPAQTKPGLGPIALANKMGWGLWDTMTKQELYPNPAAAMA